MPRIKLPNDGKGRGTYSAFYLTSSSNKRLAEWGVKNNIQNMHGGEGNEFHITICYSVLPVAYVACGRLPPLPVQPKQFAIFGKEKEYLVLEVESPFVRNRNEYGRLLGAVSTFPDYKPHISLAKDSGLNSTRNLSPIEFPLYLAREEVTAIDPRY